MPLKEWLGLTTICNLDDDNILLPFRRWSYFDECPLVSATPENLVNVLQELITRPELRTKLGKAGRKYVEKYHGEDSADYLYKYYRICLWSKNRFN